MTERNTLPQRRASENFDLNFGGISQNYNVTIGRYADGRIGEVFIDFLKSGSQAEAIARDAAIILSIGLQFGASLSTIANAITRNMQNEPQSIIGAVVCALEKRNG